MTATRGKVMRTDRKPVSMASRACARSWTMMPGMAAAAALTASASEGLASATSTAVGEARSVKPNAAKLEALVTR